MPKLLRSISFVWMFSLTVYASEHQVLILDDDRAATQARIDLILKAQKTIKLQYFYYGKDEASLAGLALLADAALRGVKVQLLIDGHFNYISKPMLAYLISVGVDVREYHPFRWSRLHWITRRMHDKGVSIDGVEMIRGGRNVQNSYFGLSKVVNFVDRDIYVKGQEVSDSDQYFDELFASDEVAPVQVSVTPEARQEASFQIFQSLQASASYEGLRFQNPLDWASSPDATTVEHVDFLFDPVGKKHENNGIAQKLAALMMSAEHSILIESPYFIPTKEFLALVKTLKSLKPHVKITLITNSAVSTDGLLPAGGYIRYRKKALEAGIELYEFKGPSNLHAKSMVIDGRIAVVASYNLDPRSQFLNTEIGVVVRDPVVATKLTSSISGHIQNSWKIAPNGLPTTGENPLDQLTFKKKMILKFAYCASYFIKNQL